MTKAGGSGCRTACRRSARPSATGRTCRSAASPIPWRGSATAGPDDFYEGDIARSIAADVRAAGGVLSGEDLARCRARVMPALAIPYRGATLQAAPGLTAGPTLAFVLERLSRQRFGASPDAAYFAAVIETLQHAYADRLDHAGDVETVAPTSTTHITAIDREGTIVALTTTLLSSFGSRYVLPSTGILMNNGIMWFDPRPGRPNSMMPGKRALTNMCPVVAARDGRPWFGIGASGGRRILAAVLQMASFVVDFGMDPEAAAHHPRIDVNGGERFGDRPPPSAGDRRAVDGETRRDPGRARCLPGALRLPEPGDAWRRRVEPRHYRRDVAVVGRDRRTRAYLSGRVAALQELRRHVWTSGNRCSWLIRR